jgi:hypothetical protein
MDDETLLALADRAPEDAWLRLARLIETGDAERLDQWVVTDALQAIIESDSLPAVIDDLERVFAASRSFQRLFVGMEPGRAERRSDEVERVAVLIGEAERRHAVVTEFESLEGRPHTSLRDLVGTARGKVILHRTSRSTPAAGSRPSASRDHD